MRVSVARLIVDDKKVLLTGRFPSIARLEDEYYDWVDDPHTFLARLKTANVAADVFTFLQTVGDNKPPYGFYSEWDSIAVLPITTYDNWWTKQINVKTRNMVRKAEKSKVEVRLVDFTDDLVRRIKEIYDESPVRQGKPFKHYRKDLATIKRDHISFLDRSQFIGAYYEDELIGFVKLVHDEGVSHLMQIISKIGHRSKAPTNALLAKAVEICAMRGIPYLHYGIWSRRGLGDFKLHHAFERLDLARYFIPLTLKGKLFLALRLHRKLSDYVPQQWIDGVSNLRSKWNVVKYKVGKA